jgi:hypothetical protein
MISSPPPFSPPSLGSSAPGLDDELGPLDHDLSDLLRESRVHESMPPPSARARSFEAVMAKVAAAEVAELPAPPATPATSARGAAAASTASRWTLALSALVLGALLGALAASTLTSAKTAPQEPRATSSAEIVYVPREVMVPYAVPIYVGTGTDDAPLAAKAKPIASGTSEGRLAAERGLLDAARVALASGAPDEAVKLAERHRREFPSGMLVEEREAIATKALVDAHRYAEARVRGAAFERRFPQSAMLRSVRSSLATITPRAEPEGTP